MHRKHFAFLLLSASLPALAQNNAKLAGTPPMGWNSWNTFRCNITESLVKGIADVMVSSGMKEAGYQYVNIDDCWMDGRDADGKLRWNKTKFPSGIPALAEYIHGKGLKVGIYETPNTSTCVGIYSGVSPSIAVGSLGHETTDAQTFASWGVDFLKYDLCKGQRSGFAVMRDALRATGRPIVLSINPGNTSTDLCPPNRCSLDLPTIANMWRITTDITASWTSVMRIMDVNAPLWSYAGPGHWNDPDMLEVGNGGLSETEGRTHFGMWAIMAAPLIAGNDLRSMNAATRATLTNREVIAVNQDSLGVQGRKVATPGTNLEVWSKQLSGTNVRAVALLNRSGAAASIKVSWTEIGLPAGKATVRDLWGAKDVGVFDGSYSVSVPSHGTAVLRISSGTTPTGLGAPLTQGRGVRTFLYPGNGRGEFRLLGGQAAGAEPALRLVDPRGKLTRLAPARKDTDGLAFQVPADLEAGVYHLQVGNGSSMETFRMPFVR
jgi:alpha-galactosidase